MDYCSDGMMSPPVFFLMSLSLTSSPMRDAPWHFLNSVLASYFFALFCFGEELKFVGSQIENKIFALMRSRPLARPASHPVGMFSFSTQFPGPYRGRNLQK